ncbi:MAG TPA: hypothetical protein VG963_07985 [Polyangiaceae bacterium]|nr:hypothetical protein [Polyangiaceae bacterium]
MSVTARIGELLVESRVGFSLRQFEDHLAQLLSALPQDFEGRLELRELVVEASPTLQGAAQAVAQALAERCRKGQGP